MHGESNRSEADARELFAELRADAKCLLADADAANSIVLRSIYARTIALDILRAADALEAFRAACVAFLDHDARALSCRYCSAYDTAKFPGPPSIGSILSGRDASVHAPTCPVALARAAMEKYP